MAFSMGVSAFLAVKYYRYLKGAFGGQGVAAFQAGFHHYATQRGRRMAQRAIRDGLPLTYESYCLYPEVVQNEEMKRVDRPGRSEIIPSDKDHISHVYACPVHDKFSEMSAEAEIGEWYCSHIDIYQCEGFNPEIGYHVDQTLCSADYCIHRVENAKTREDAPSCPRRVDDAPPFAYICANFYFSMKESIVAIFGEKGDEIAERVREDYINEYGQGDWDEIMRYEKANFNVRYRKEDA